MTLKEILFGGGSALFVLLTLLQLAPIKINPWSAIALLSATQSSARITPGRGPVRSTASRHTA